MRRLMWAVVILGIIGLGVFYVLTMPSTIDAAALPKHTADIKNGETMFHAGGCASCHAAPPVGSKCEDPGTPDKLNLAGGRCLITPFGTFHVPNISPDKEDGIGGWTDIEFVNAMMRGVSPSGQHYYPAFPYTSYQRMRYEDVMDLKAFIDTLKPIKSTVADHDLPLPFQLRRGLGMWKLLFLDEQQLKPDPAKSAKVNRGAYLVEGPGHCGECHSPRTFMGAGGVDRSKNLAGGPSPEGGDIIPNITPHDDGIGSWSEDEIVEALMTGATPSFDILGGTMTKVQENMAKLSEDDLYAIAAYLKAIPAIPGPEAEKKASAAN